MDLFWRACLSVCLSVYNFIFYYNVALQYIIDILKKQSSLFINFLKIGRGIQKLGLIDLLMNFYQSSGNHNLIERISNYALKPIFKSQQCRSN